MKYRPNLKGFFLLAHLSLASTAFAQALPGTFSYHFTTNEGPALWNFSGSYATPYYVTNDTLELRHDGKGGLEAYYRAGGGFVLGTVRGGSSTLKLNLFSEMSFPGASPDLRMRRRDRLALNFDAETGTLIGTDRVEEAYQVVVYDEFPYSHLKTVARHSTRYPVTLEVPGTTDGAWILTLNIIPTGNKLAGTGSIHFGNGTAYEFQLIGSYSQKSRKSKVLLKGAGASKGATLVLSIVNPEMGIERMSGRVGGQSVKLRL